MTEIKHTPAPWFSKGDFIGTIEDDPQTIAYVADNRNRKQRSEQESQANAQLVAAAPELLEALVQVLKKMKDLSVNDWYEYCQDSSDEFEEVKAAQAAITKATAGN